MLLRDLSVEGPDAAVSPFSSESSGGGGCVGCEGFKGMLQPHR